MSKKSKKFVELTLDGSHVSIRRKSITHFEASVDGKSTRIFTKNRGWDVLGSYEHFKKTLG